MSCGCSVDYINCAGCAGCERCAGCGRALDCFSVEIRTFHLEKAAREAPGLFTVRVREHASPAAHLHFLAYCWHTGRLHSDGGPVGQIPLLEAPCDWL
jgi:hypothetical protein